MQRSALLKDKFLVNGWNSLSAPFQEPSWGGQVGRRGNMFRMQHFSLDSPQPCLTPAVEGQDLGAGPHKAGAP